MTLKNENIYQHPDVMDTQGEKEHLLKQHGHIVWFYGLSGSGKSTLLHVLAGLIECDEGRVVIAGEEITSGTADTKAGIRNRLMGFVYQFHHLLSEFSALENIAFPRLINGEKKALAFERANELLNKMGLAHRINNRPAELSGGEQQRVAFARAIINKPELILADEPTGSLDQSTSKEIFNLFLKFKSQNRSIIYATHNRQLADKADYKLSIIDGSIKRING